MDKGLGKLRHLSIKSFSVNGIERAGEEVGGEWKKEKTDEKEAKGKARVIDQSDSKEEEKGKARAATQWQKVTGSRGRLASSPSPATPSATAATVRPQERTVISKALFKKPGVFEGTYPGLHRSDGGSASIKKVIWADEVGLALTHIALGCPEDPTLTPRSSDTSTIHNRRRSDAGFGKTIPSCTTGFCKTYKEALLTPTLAPLRDTRRGQGANFTPVFNTPPKSFFTGKCFRCLGTNHRAASCREPLRCAWCFKMGHVARSCMDRLPMAVYREMRARPFYLSAFVPLTEDFYTRQNRCRNAILVDVLPPKNLGHFAQETIANRLASRFGGFSTDFHVAKFSQREFLIFLPEWVPADQLIRREILSLDNLRLHCSPWNPYHGLRRASLTYNVWIRLVCLPYECWSSRTVAALVGGFGRFIHADDFSTRMVDLTGYRCLIFVNFLSDIPKNLEITVGDHSLSVLIQLERWGRRDVVDLVTP
uniref:CCHC-type domain-containing protein n=1 Tax=Ananas comosus var. bracteatus TaxID=296719 RepID=A0A6V7QKE2_ANACO|nr:unnamed protein product [Ananas comosus var. bracteatus]